MVPDRVQFTFEQWNYYRLQWGRDLLVPDSTNGSDGRDVEGEASMGPGPFGPG